MHKILIALDKYRFSRALMFLRLKFSIKFEFKVNDFRAKLVYIYYALIGSWPILDSKNFVFLYITTIKSGKNFKIL